jgi:tRNA G18 (ribose-2'-O)-methylase SpoU
MRKLQSSEIDRPAAEDLQHLPRHPLVVVLDSIRSAYNVGSILRTADAVRAEQVVCCGYTPSPAQSAVRKTALGADETVPWSVVENPLEVLTTFRRRGYTLAALEQTDTPTPLADLRPAHFPIVLILGNEVEGVQQRVLDVCDLALQVPQYGAKHSLNVAVAFGVAAYGLLERITA